MKSTILLTLMVGLLVSVTTGFSQEGMMGGKQQMMGQNMQQQMDRHQQMMSMMGDSTLMHMMMDSIATNQNMRMTMLSQMMQSVQSDPTQMRQMVQTMMQNQEMRSIMMQMLGSQSSNSENAAREVIVKFKPGVKASQISEMEKTVGLKKVKDISALNMQVFEITSQKSVAEAIKDLQKEPFVQYAEPNQTYKANK